MSNKISRREFIKKSAIGIVVGGTVLSSLDIAELAAKSNFGKIFRNGNDIVAVSYTHLDVYKRQLLYCQYYILYPTET